MYDSNYMTSSKRQNYGDIKNINCFQGLGREGEMNKQITDDIQDIKL